VRSTRGRQIRLSAEALYIAIGKAKQVEIDRKRAHYADIKGRKEAWLRYISNNSMCTICYAKTNQSKANRTIAGCELQTILAIVVDGPMMGQVPMMSPSEQWWMDRRCIGVRGQRKS